MSDSLVFRGGAEVKLGPSAFYFVVFLVHSSCGSYAFRMKLRINSETVISFLTASNWTRLAIGQGIDTEIFAGGFLPMGIP